METVEATDATVEEFAAKKRHRWQKARDSGRLIRTKDIGRQGSHYWAPEALTLMPQTGGYPKVYVIERLRHVRSEGVRSFEGGTMPGDAIYRIGYFTKSPKSRRWIWGQYSPLISEGDLRPLLDQARREKTIQE